MKQISGCIMFIFITGLMAAWLVLTPLSQAADSGTFNGTWVANGTREPLPFGEDRVAALFKLSGHVNLKAGISGLTDFWSQCIGLADSKTGSQARCTWKSPYGTMVYISLHSERMAEEISVQGTIEGGTGAAEGITGTLQFTWSSMTFQRENNTTAVGGYAKELKGTYQIP